MKNFKVCYLASVLCCLTLGIIEVCWDSDDGVGHMAIDYRLAYSGRLDCVYLQVPVAELMTDQLLECKHSIWRADN